MGQKEAVLKSLLRVAGYTCLGRPTASEVLNSPYAEEVLSVYQRLGGVPETIAINLRTRWDMEFEGVAVELDEQLHFNRYRALTLESGAYTSLPAFPQGAYRDYCVDREPDCLRAGGYGGKWTNPSCEKQFGKSPTPRDLVPRGPARWRQRAFYDFVKDLSPLIIGVPVVRIAIWDQLETDAGRITVDTLLHRPGAESAEALICLIRKRTPSIGTVRGDPISHA